MEVAGYYTWGTTILRTLRKKDGLELFVLAGGTWRTDLAAACGYFLQITLVRRDISHPVNSLFDLVSKGISYVYPSYMIQQSQME